MGVEFGQEWCVVFEQVNVIIMDYQIVGVIGCFVIYVIGYNDCIKVFVEVLMKKCIVVVRCVIDFYVVLCVVY